MSGWHDSGDRTASPWGLRRLRNCEILLLICPGDTAWRQNRPNHRAALAVRYWPRDSCQPFRLRARAVCLHRVFTLLQKMRWIEPKTLDCGNLLRYLGATHTPGRCLSASFCPRLHADLAEPHEFVSSEANQCKGRIRRFCPW